MNRDWPPPAQPKPKSTGSSMVMLSLMIFLLIGSILGAWLVAALPGDQPWAPAIVPAGWMVALVVFLIGTFINWRNAK